MFWKIFPGNLFLNTFSEIIVFVCVSHQHEDEGEDSHQPRKCEKLDILQKTSNDQKLWIKLFSSKIPEVN